jgi:gliding motility-associated-like protein
MKNNCVTLFFAALFCSFWGSYYLPVFSQISMTPIAQSPLQVLGDERNTFEDLNFRSMLWVEDISARTEFTASYKTEDGYIRVEHSQKPIHRKVNGIWEKIDPSMKPNDDGWYAPMQQYPVYLKTNGAFSLSLTDGQTWSFGSQTQCLGENLTYLASQQDGQVFYFNSNASVAHVKEILAFENGVKYNYRFNELPAIGNNDLVFTERIVLPKNYKLTAQVETRETFWGLIPVSYFLILDINGNVVGRIEPAYAVDANQASEPVYYDLIDLGAGEYDLHIRLKNNWLMSPERVFPLLIDPLVVGPLSQWAGGQMPSCITPQQNIDSILVTIPAGVTPISLAVGSSFYADPFTSAIMSQGAMQFSTTCAATQSYQITSGPTANLPGTAYLDSANILSPLTCCFQKSCTQQQFYLRKHLSRTGPGTGCNTTFIRYDPFTTQWPFRATVYGRTLETYANEWSVPQAQRCSDNCEFNATAYVRYGVPPYTFTHPWQDTIIVEGNANGCNTGQTNVQFQLTIPNCPIYCDPDYTGLPVPNPTVIDACGVAVTGFPLRNLNIKPAPQILPLADTIFCAGETIDLTVANCLGEPEITWSAGDLSGTTSINIPTDANLQGTFIYNVLILSTVNGCEAEPLFQPIYVLPLPTVSFVVASENTFLGDLIEFQNTSTGVSLEGNEWLWQFGDGSSVIGINAQHTYNTIGIYEVCLSLAAGSECSNEYCQMIPVVPNAIVVPNVFSPNGDATNEVLNLFFEWAEKVEMQVVNRWGIVMAEVVITDYNGGWDGKDQSSGADAPEGVYFYQYKITTTLGGTLEGQSFVHLIRQ